MAGAAQQAVRCRPPGRAATTNRRLQGVRIARNNQLIMSEKVVLLLGAGASVSDVATRSLTKRPPLDARFFSIAAASHSDDVQLNAVRGYFNRTYGIDICAVEHDSMETVMASLYPDLFNSSLSTAAEPTFRALLQLFTNRLARTTNNLRPTQKRLLYRMLSHMLADEIDPCDITIITFNQDIQAEKMLEHLSQAKRWARKASSAFAFPALYAIPESKWKGITYPKGAPDCFTHTKTEDPCLQVLKLHGSLNWYSNHTSKNPSREAMLRQGRPLSVTRRRTISTTMTISGKRTTYALPVVVPPVTHKSSVVPSALGPIWSLAEKRLVEADRVVVFGYSCPQLDFESANLLRRSQEKRSEKATFTVIDPEGAVATRYIGLLRLSRLHYYATGHDYLAPRS